MAEVGRVKFATVARRVGQSVLPAYRRKLSEHESIPLRRGPCSGGSPVSHGGNGRSPARAIPRHTLRPCVRWHEHPPGSCRVHKPDTHETASLVRSGIRRGLSST
jgi:hypothetical protein